MLVGEAPGRSEDAAGEPFVGAAGQVLNQALGEAGLSRERLFLTNVVKCRPPGNRLPRANECQTCVNTYLRRQLAYINPVVICLLGRTAAKTMVGGGPLAEVRGRLMRRQGRLFLATYHPAAVNRTPSLKALFQSDLKRLADYVARRTIGHREA